MGESIEKQSSLVFLKIPGPDPGVTSTHLKIT